MTQGTIKPQVVQNMLVNLVLTAAVNMLQQDGTEKEDWVAERLLAQVEQYDQLIPGLKAYADLPFVDDLEKKGTQYLVRFCIRKAYAWAVANNQMPQSVKPPEVEPTEDDKKVADALGVPADKVLVPITPGEVTTQSVNNQGGQGDDAPDYDELVEDYAKGGGWYEFPAQKEGTEAIKKQGKEAAVEYLKTRDDLVYE